MGHLGLPMGETFSVASRYGTSAEEQAQITFSHELGHHIHLSAKNWQLQNRVNDIIDNAYTERGFADNPRLVQDVLEKNVESPAVSRYAATDPMEYFAESFAAYLRDSYGLRKHDKIGFDMVAKVLTALHIE